MPRSRLGPLAVESKLGENSGAGCVYRAVHVNLKKAIAVRVFSIPFGGTPEARKQFAAEWESLKQLQHPAIARCFGGGFEESDAYLAHELIEGESLESQFSKNEKQPWEAVLDMAETLVDALEYLHRKGIVHGSLEPEKVMISGLSPVLLDVRIHRFNTPFRNTRPRRAQELAMQAPELVKDPSAISQQTDLYALAAILYHAMTGHAPIDGNTVEEVKGNLEFQTPVSPAKIVLDCPIWLDKLLMQMLQKDPAARLPNATAVKAALADVRKRAMSRSGVAEHASSGFSPLQVTDQQQRDEARSLLGRTLVSFRDEEPEEKIADATLWHDSTWFLVGGMFLLLGLLAWVATPDSEATLVRKAEELLAQDTRSALTQAKMHPLRQIINRFPESENAVWAQEEIDRIEVVLFLHQLSVKIKNNLPIKKQEELLHKRAQQYVEIGDVSRAIDKYQSIITVLSDDAEYEVAVNAARFQIAALKESGGADSEATKIIQKRMQEAEDLMAENRVVEARDIWYSLVDLYGGNSDLDPLIAKVQQKLQENKADDNAQVE